MLHYFSEFGHLKLNAKRIEVKPILSLYYNNVAQRILFLTMVIEITGNG